VFARESEWHDFGQRRATKRLTAISKERLQHFRAASGQHSAANRDLVVQLRMIQDLHYRMHGPRLGVVRAIYQALHAGVHQGASAHRAGLNGDKQRAPFEAMVTYGCTGFTQRDDLGVGGWVAVCNVAVPSSAYNPASACDLAVADVVAYYDRTHGNFPSLQRSLGAAQSFLHPEFVGMKVVGMLLAGARGPVLFVDRRCIGESFSCRH
jgi:hypothetical protein